MKKFPIQTQVVIIGGGLIGCSTAYHLAKAGVKDVVLLERKTLGCGTSWHAAGILSELRPSESMIWLCRQTTKLLREIEKESGIDIHFKPVGSLYVSAVKDRIEQFKMAHTLGKSFGVESEFVSLSEVKKMWPLLNTDDLQDGSMFVPNDALVNPYQTVKAFAKLATDMGVTILEETPAKKILKQGNQVIGVSTNEGDIRCESVVICGGIWSRDFSTDISLNVPLHASEHYYILTEEIEGVDSDLALLRDFDARTYVRPDAGTYWHDSGKRLMCGFFEKVSKPWGMDGIPEDFSFGHLKEDWKHLEEVIGNVKNRIPAIADVKVETLFNGPESFTYDNTYFIGKAPETKELYVCTGFCSRGLQSAAGAGELITDWVINKRQTIPLDTNDIDVRRCPPFTSNRKYLHDRSIEVLGLLYDIQYPYLEMKTARPVRTTPFHDRLKKAGAVFGQRNGWERANFYVRGNEPTAYGNTFGRQNWHEPSAREHQATRENVAVFDQTTFAKYLVQGRDALTLLNGLCGKELDTPVGKITYTQALNENGGIEGDWTIIRVAEDQFWVITAVVSQARDFEFIRDYMTPEMNASITDITSSYAVLGIMGPRSRDLMSKMGPTDFSNENFPFGTSQVIDFGYAKVRANRLSFVGELGWEIFIPTEFALSAYDQLIEQGKQFDLANAGVFAMESLRLEKAYRHWGHDISPADTPLEAGLGFAVDLAKPNFNGRQRLIQQKLNGLHKRMAIFRMEDPNPILYHHETVYRNGKIAGHLTGGMYCHTLETSTALGYLHDHHEILTRDYMLDAKYEVEVMGKRYPVSISLRPLYDPKNLRMKA